MAEGDAPGRGERLMEVEVHFRGKSGDEVLASRSVRLSEGTTVDGWLRHLSGLCGFDVREATVESQPYFLIIKGSFCDVSKSLGRRLGDSDAVAVLPLVAGG